MKHQMIKAVLVATMLLPVNSLLSSSLGSIARADDAVVEVAPSTQPARMRVAARAIAGPHNGVFEVLPEGGEGQVINIVGNGQPMRSMTFLNAGGKLEKGTFLGVTTSTVPAALRAQMSLQKGFGLVVETIEKDSPAEKAGIEKYDILQKLNDQLLVNQQQLQVLVRSMKAGDSVAITLLRKGQPMTLNAALVEKDVPEMADDDATTGFFGGINTAPAVMKLEGAIDPRNILRKLNINAGQASSIVVVDGDQTLELTTKDGTKNLMVKDNQADKMLFNGPIDTAEQRDKLPEGVAAKLDKLESKLQKITVRATVNTARTPEDEK